MPISTRAAVGARPRPAEVRNKTTTIDWQDKDDDKDLSGSQQGAG